jgi:hypothetical protein
MKAIIFSCLVLLISACTDSGDSSDGGGSSGGDSSLQLRLQEFSAVAGSNGQASFNVNLPVGTTSFQLAANNGSLSALSSGGLNFFNRNDLLSSRQQSLTSNAPYYFSTPNTFSNLTLSYQAEPGSTVNLKVHSKVDASNTSGTLKVNIVLLGPVADSEDVSNALDTALSVVRSSFSRAGIRIDSLITSFNGPGVAPAPGDPLYQSIVSSQRQQAINVIIAADKRGSSSNENRYSIIGTTPFPVQPNAQSVAVVSLDDITGDGVFDDSNHNDEDRLLGEEIGRIIANALGLPNIVQFRGSDVVSSDDIPDSPSCISEQACEEDSTSRTNLMMPEPMRQEEEDRDSRGTSYYPRDQLSSGQKLVLNNSIFVD